jgi:hypothetical protein
METYTLTLFSGQTTNRTGTDLSDYSYYVNWGSIIPEKYRSNKFLISFTFHSDFTAVAGSRPAVVFANGLNLINQNFQGEVNILGVIIPNVIKTQVINAWTASTTDNQPVMGNYPNSNTLNIQLMDVTNNAILAVPSMNNYIMMISFTPIKDNNNLM